MASSTPPHDVQVRQRFQDLLSNAGLDGEDAAPRIGLIAGSGMSGLATALSNSASLDLCAIEGNSPAPVAGHAGTWSAGLWAGTPIHLVAGRHHYYEGIEPARAMSTARWMANLGVRLVILTNAAGGLAPTFKPGELMLIRDHLNLSFRSPLAGPNEDKIGPRFPDLSAAYDPAAQAMVRKAAHRAGVRLHEGVYAQVAGPNFETPAEIRMLRRLGAHAVGMSTIPEVLAARHAGVKVVGLSLITNDCLRKGIGPDGMASHEEVLRVADSAQTRLRNLLESALPTLNRLTNSPAFGR